MYEIDMAKGAKKIIEVCACARKGEKVLIVTDTNISLTIAKALAIAAKNIEAELAIIITSPGENPGEELNSIVAAAMSEADLIIAPTTRSIYHTDAAMRATKNGARLIALTEFTEEGLISGGIEADFHALQPRISYVSEKFNSGRMAHITAPGGTDIWVDITKRESYSCSGICDKPGMKMGFPDVEVFIAPIESKTNGVLVVDASATGIGLVKEPIKLIINDGKVKEIQGSDEANKLHSILENSLDPNSYIVAEFAIGLNDKSRVIGNIIEDEGVYGTGHFALGNNINFGGKNKAPIHIDMVYWKPTIKIDGEIIMRDGELVQCL